MELKAATHLRPSWCPRVSIAPLWNWKLLSSQLSSITSCFNRTFMELKAYSIRLFFINNTFQSHLYGIESEKFGRLRGPAGVSIAPLWNWKTDPRNIASKEPGFNRTFMELKGLMLKLCTPTRWFQSHLYGIERTGRGRAHRSPWVSIAPLWNWKERVG